MPYGIIQKLLAKQLNDHQDTVLIESPFRETTRSGTYLRSVLLGVTTKNMVVATNTPDLWIRNSSDKLESPSDRPFKIRSVYPMQAVKFSIFKRSKRQSLKASFQNSTVRYYELGHFDKRKIFWELWCNHAMESSSGTKIWPFAPDPPLHVYSQDTLSDQEIDCIQIQDIINKKNQEKNKKKWTDKYLYLGTNRELEDRDRPCPLPGLGPTEDIKLLYLKQRYFGCWEQSEHWVQCESVQDAICDYNEYTYTGGPTSNVTYTSLMTTWK